MSLRTTLVPDPDRATVGPTPCRPASNRPAESSGDGRGEGTSSRDAGARRGRRAARPVSTTTGHAEIPAAPTAPIWGAPLHEMSSARTEPITLRPLVLRPSSNEPSEASEASEARREQTRIGAPLPPARIDTPYPMRIDATIVCNNPVLRTPEPDEEGGTLVRLTAPVRPATPPRRTTLAISAPPPDWAAGSITEAGTVICRNPLLLVPDPPSPAPAPTPTAAPAPETAPVAPIDPPAAAARDAIVCGATAIFLGRLNDPATDDRSPVFVPEGESLEVGSKRGSPFARDPYVARYHAALVPMQDGVLVEDFGTANGVYVRVEGRVPLRDDDRLRIGQQLLRFLRFTHDAAAEDSVRRVGSPDPGAWGRLAIMLDAHREAAAYPLRRDLVELGQQTGDVQFPCDRHVGEPHCRLLRGDDGPAVEVAPGGPATYVRVDRGDVVPYGSELLIGETRLRLDETADPAP